MGTATVGSRPSAAAAAAVESTFRSGVAGSLGEADPFRLDRLGKHLLACAPLRTPTHATARALAATLGIERVLITRATEGGQALIAVAQTGFTAAELDCAESGIPLSGWLARALAAGAAAFTPSAGANEVLPVALARALRIGPLICAPLRAQQGTYGALLADNAGAPFPISELLLAIATAAGAGVGCALAAAGERAPCESFGAPSRQRAQTPPELSLRLTPRELEILELIGAGLTNREIAAARGLSTFTVRDHISNLLRKLQVGNRAAALVKAQELQLLGACSAT
ncbi:MAG TPA: response regulator transcription factor [Solirubrobacteraceae bacterium]|nr:response regulator transcription factor [Solirubrobacteraceae bacterium]